MDKKYLEEKFNIGIPCYNKTFFNIKDFTLNGTVKGYRESVIDKERALREEGKKVLEDITGVKSSVYESGPFHYVSLGSNTDNSNTNLGFDDTSKLSSLFYKNKKEPLCGITDRNIYKIIDREINQNHQYTKEQYEAIKDILLKYDFNSLQDDYFKGLDTRKVEKVILEQQCSYVVHSIKNKRFDIAQKYLFFLSAYLHEYGNIDLIIDNNVSINLKDFINTMMSKYNLKDEYLLRSGFIGESFEDNNNIINTIINKKDITLQTDLCESGHVDRKPSEPTGKKRIPLTEAEIKEIENKTNDRHMFFLNLNPVAEIKPETGSFKQYCAFVYENGIIVADRLYNITTLNALNQNAIYKFDALNFDELKELSKQDLIGKKIYHTGTWKPRTKKYITQDTSDELHEAAKELVKRKSI